MTEKKLTAKLSDGRELDVCSEWHAKEDNYTMIVAKPKQEKPSPPKEVWVPLYSNGSLVGSYASKDEAPPNKDTRSTHRYILAEEPKVEEKQPREWWEVRYKRPSDRVYCSVDTREQAEDIARKESDEAFRQFEIVHVREVLDEGQADKSRVYHLQFRKNGKLLRVLGPIENGNGMPSLLFEDQEHKDEYADEVVRVRQSIL